MPQCEIDLLVDFLALDPIEDLDEGGVETVEKAVAGYLRLEVVVENLLQLFLFIVLQQYDKYS